MTFSKVLSILPFWLSSSFAPLELLQPLPIYQMLLLSRVNVILRFSEKLYLMRVLSSSKAA